MGRKKSKVNKNATATEQEKNQTVTTINNNNNNSNNSNNNIQVGKNQNQQNNPKQNTLKSSLPTTPFATMPPTEMTTLVSMLQKIQESGASDSKDIVVQNNKTQNNETQNSEIQKPVRRIRPPRIFDVERSNPEEAEEKSSGEISKLNEIHDKPKELTKKEQREKLRLKLQDALVNKSSKKSAMSGETLKQKNKIETMVKKKGVIETAKELGCSDPKMLSALKEMQNDAKTGNKTMTPEKFIKKVTQSNKIM